MNLTTYTKSYESQHVLQPQQQCWYHSGIPYKKVKISNIYTRVAFNLSLVRFQHAQPGASNLRSIVTVHGGGSAKFTITVHSKASKIQQQWFITWRNDTKFNARTVNFNKKKKKMKPNKFLHFKNAEKDTREIRVMPFLHSSCD